MASEVFDSVTCRELILADRAGDVMSGGKTVSGGLIVSGAKLMISDGASYIIVGRQT